MLSKQTQPPHQPNALLPPLLPSHLIGLIDLCPMRWTNAMRTLTKGHPLLCQTPSTLHHPLLTSLFHCLRLLLLILPHQPLHHLPFFRPKCHTTPPCTKTLTPKALPSRPFHLPPEAPPVSS